VGAGFFEAFFEADFHVVVFAEAADKEDGLGVYVSGRGEMDGCGACTFGLCPFFARLAICLRTRRSTLSMIGSKTGWRIDLYHSELEALEW
jgi:hypothetical protein